MLCDLEYAEPLVRLLVPDDDLQSLVILHLAVEEDLLRALVRVERDALKVDVGKVQNVHWLSG